ncbi:MAG: ubiquitin carboxyl-terminal hydrolase family protein, partial [Chlamydiota bacterium]
KDEFMCNKAPPLALTASPTFSLPPDPSQSEHRIFIEGRRYRIYVVNAKQERCFLPKSTFALIATYCKKDLAKLPAPPTKKTYSYDPKKETDSDTAALFKTIQNTTSGVFMPPESPLKSEGKEPSSASRTKSRRKRTKALLFTPKYSPQENDAQVVREYGAKGFIRHRGNQTCWAGALFITTLLQDDYFINQLQEKYEAAFHRVSRINRKDFTENGRYLPEALAFLSWAKDNRFLWDGREEFMNKDDRDVLDALLEKQEPISLSKGDIRAASQFIEQANRDLHRVRALLAIRTQYRANNDPYFDATSLIQTVFADITKMENSDEFSEGRICKTAFNMEEMHQQLEKMYERLIGNTGQGAMLAMKKVLNQQGNAAVDSTSFRTHSHFQLLALKGQYSLEDLFSNQYLVTEELPRNLHIAVHRRSLHSRQIIREEPVEVTSRMTVHREVLQEGAFDKVESREYELLGFAIHGDAAGKVQLGRSPCHYVSYAKRKQQDGSEQWFFFNDHKVTPISNEEALKAAQYASNLYFTKAERKEADELD